jgi:2-polyprenyl-3-methyl-5-hydroxy-6-metoxy-1,4-benzoquinol methylase
MSKSNKDFETIYNCIVCNEPIQTILDLGCQPLANNYLADYNQKEDKYPLQLCLCKCCYHLQLNCIVKPEKLFEHYVYTSGTSQTMLSYFDEFATKSLTSFISKRKIVNNRIKVLEIACNDGSQLDAFVKSMKAIDSEINVTCVGVDPAKNIYNEISSKKSHDIYCEFFTQETVRKLQSKYGTFDIIVAQNVFAHVSYPHQFLQYLSQMMHDGTQLYIQTSQKNMILENQFDTVYHEHISFFNANSMKKLCEANGLILNNIDEHSVHGTSYIFNISLTKDPHANINEVWDKEQMEGLYSLDTYEKYKALCIEYKRHFCEKLNGKTNVMAFGSTAKSMTILNYCDVSSEQISVVIDENPLKQNLYTPGSHIRVGGISELQTINCDTAIIITAWNFYDEIKNKICDKLIEYDISAKVTLLNLDTLEEEIVN